MRMDRRIGLAALDVERYSKQGTADLQTGNIDKALDAFKYAYKRSRDVDDGYTERACAFNLGAAYIAANQAKRGLDVLQQAVPPDNKREGRSNGDLYFNFGLGFENLGNLGEAVRNYTKAYEEYKSERDNLQMEAESLEKLANLQVKTENIFAEDSLGKLADVYALMNKPVKQLESFCQKANQQHKQNKSTECEATADECLKLTEKCGPVAEVGTVLNDIGLIYTQMHKYDRAIACFEQALPLVRGRSGDKKQEAVILQNLGATYNFLGDYQRAVGFHESASSLYAELKNRNSQGQCFANLAFALSQLGDKEGAGEAFLHAHQAAKDTGDTRTQWQVLEGLGAVAYNNGNIARAIDCFKRALAVIAASESNTVVQDRIVGKLTHALQEQIIRKSGGTNRRDHVKTDQHHVTLANILPSRASKGAVPAPLKDQPIQEEAVEPVTATTQQEGRRFVPVNRPGSRREFQKVARGLSSLGSMSMDGSETLRPGALLESSSESSSSSSSSSSSEEDSQDERRKAKVKVEVEPQESLQHTSKYGSLTASKRLDTKSVRMQRKPLLSTASEKSSSSDSSSSSSSEEEEGEKEEDDDDEHSDKKAVEAAMKKFAEDKETSSSSSEDEETKQEDKPKHVHALVTVDERSKESSSSPSSSSSSSSSDEEEKSPPLPTSSPFLSGRVNTYETPGLKYGKINFETNQKGEVQDVASTHNKGDNPNYLSGQSDLSKDEDDDHEDESDDEFDFENSGNYETVDKLKTKESSVTPPLPSQTAAAAARASGNWEDHRVDDPTYQSIDFRTRQEGLPDTPSFEHVSDLPRGESLARADQESYLHNEHMKLVDNRKTGEDNHEQKAKDSKTCVVM